MHAVSALIAAVLMFGSAGPPRSVDGFLPSVHGFRFANSFHGSPSPIPLGGLDVRLGAPEHYGLCGGMSFAAADFFLAGRAVPRDDREPRAGSTLFKYLRDRQTASLGPKMQLIGTFGRWMSAPDEGLSGTRSATLLNLPAMLETLAAGRPVVLGLVYVRYANNRGSAARAGTPWENHQVLGIGTERVAGGVTLRVYDPNYPLRDDVRIRCDLAIVDVIDAGAWDPIPTPVLGVRCVQHVGERARHEVRGMVMMPYEARVPGEMP